MKSASSYVIANNIPNLLSKMSQQTVKISNSIFWKTRRAQKINPAWVQMHKYTVNDYFRKLEFMASLELFNKPGEIMDKKECSLTVYKQQVLFAKIMSKRVYLIASEHGVKITIVGCGNTLSQVVPQYILFREQR